MGEVYRARDTRLDRFVALKVLSPDFDAGRRGQVWFEREARALSQLSHPHICTVHDIGCAEIEGRQVPFLVMEMLNGETLAARLARGALPLVESITYAIDIADALATAHDHGVVHRDLKPANVMVTNSGVKLLDFGLAQLRGMVPTQASLATQSFQTSAGMVFGTIPYMAPEQLRGEHTDARTDVFAFGVLLHEMLTGRRPFTAGSSAGLIAAILEHDPPPIVAPHARLPATLDHTIRRCLAKNPDQRWQTARDLCSALHGTLEEIRAAGPVRSKYLAGLAIPAAVALAGALWASWPAPDVSLPEPSLRQFTAFQGDEVHPAFSPDGGQVAFTWNGEKGDNPDIYIKRLDADTPLRLTSDPAHDLAPAWSPDGSRIAFIRGTEQTASIYLTPPVPGAERKLADYTPASLGYPTLPTRGHHVAWSPDSTLVIVAARAAGDRPGVVLAFPAAGGEPHTVLSAGPEDGDFRFPTISPDGRTLGYAVCRGQGCDLYVTALDEQMIGEGEPTQLTRQSPAPIYGLSWAADGKSLVYGSWVGTLNLWRVFIDKPEPTRLELGVYGGRPDVSRAGNRLVYFRLNNDSDIWKFEGGGDPVAVASSSLLDADAQLSPDGTRIVLASERSGTSRDLWITNADGTGAKRLTYAGGDGTPRWSPDGRWIAYDERAENGKFGIHVIEAAGGPPRRLTDDGVVPNWSRDGKWVYFASTRSGTTQVWRMPRSGGDAQQVTQQGAEGAWESWDGTTLYYDRDGGLYARAVAGGPERELLPPATGVGSRNFFPAKNRLYYAIAPDPQQSAKWEIRHLNLATGSSETIYRFESRALSQGLSVSPDETTIIFSGISPSKNSDLMLIENFR
jgi:Tol biopolymer transport system component